MVLEYSSWVVTSVRQRGVLQTVKALTAVVIDRSFDWKYGTDTLQWVDRLAIETTSQNKRWSEPYKATKAWPFRKLLRKLKLPLEGAFVDIGSGKGRILLMAAQHGFRKVVGLEFSGPLCQIARHNVEVVSRMTDLDIAVEVIEVDASEYVFRPDENVFFMFSPFGEPVVAKVMQNLRKSLVDTPRKIFLIYNYPVHHETVTRAGIFRTDAFYEIGGTHFRIYEN